MYWTRICCLLALFAYASGQEQPLQCYFCKHSAVDSAQDSDKDPSCMKHEGFAVLNDHHRQCTSGEPYCKAEVELRNEVFSGVSRDCSGEPCVVSCKRKGYGAARTTCTHCCNSSLCNNWEDSAFYNNNRAERGALCLSVFPVVQLLTLTVGRIILQ